MFISSLIMSVYLLVVTAVAAPTAAESVQPREITLDLGEPRPLRQLRFSALQDPKSWIWLPREVDVAVSTDGGFIDLEAIALAAGEDAPATLEDVIRGGRLRDVRRWSSTVRCR